MILHILVHTKHTLRFNDWFGLITFFFDWTIFFSYSFLISIFFSSDFFLLLIKCLHEINGQNKKKIHRQKLNQIKMSIFNTIYVYDQINRLCVRVIKNQMQLFSNYFVFWQFELICFFGIIVVDFYHRVRTIKINLFLLSPVPS